MIANFPRGIEFTVATEVKIGRLANDPRSFRVDVSGLESRLFLDFASGQNLLFIVDARNRFNHWERNWGPQESILQAAAPTMVASLFEKMGFDPLMAITASASLIAELGLRAADKWEQISSFDPCDPNSDALAHAMGNWQRETAGALTNIMAPYLDSRGSEA